MFDIIDYQFVLGLHITAMVANLVMVIWADALGFMWVLGRKEVLPARLVTRLHNLIWIGLAVSIATGAYLFSTASEYLLATPAFIVKLSFVAALAINSFFIGCHLSVATTSSYSSVQKKEKIAMAVSGVVSTVSWVGVIIVAQFLGL